MIEKKIRKFFNSVSIPSCRPVACNECVEEPIGELEDEIEVSPELSEEGAPKVCDYVRFMAKTFCILASVLVVGKIVALLISTVSAEDED